MWRDGRDREPTEAAARRDAAVDLLENVLRAWPRWRDAWRTRLAHASPQGSAFSGAPAKQGGTFLNHPDTSGDLVRRGHQPTQAGSVHRGNGAADPGTGCARGPTGGDPPRRELDLCR